jgi:hypothetical protein
MSTDATTPRGATGPRSEAQGPPNAAPNTGGTHPFSRDSAAMTCASYLEAGKANSSRNSTKHGLFAQRDFILEGEDEEYAQTFSDLMAELAPGSILEQTFATEIMGANWRLRRCGILEFDLARSADRAPDAQDAIQKSIDRARAQSHNILRRSLAELRKLQTERHTRILQMPDGQVPTDLGITDTRQAVNTAARSSQATDIDAKRAAVEEHWRRTEEEINAFLEDSSFCKPVKTATTAAGSSFCNPPATPRNALCPCGSGAKYKRCCGKNAPPVLNTRA